MINTSFTLPCGAELNNRLAKAAMTERLCGRNGHPTQQHIDLYNQWAETTAGLLITGNIMVDRDHLESAGNVVVDSEIIPPFLEEWANSGKNFGNHFWVQISHSGRQTSRFVNSSPLSASDVQLNKMGVFGKPRAMTKDEIQKVIRSFAIAANVCKKAGFTGVQVHSAHGYLLNQFLSPITNHRKDEWGGPLENRSRLLMSIIAEVRKAVGPEYPVSVKLNSADFQRGGFSETDSLEVIKLLESAGIDLLEISGGTYEKLAFFTGGKEKVKESTRQREAYFLDFARKVRIISNIPLMVTGGFRTHSYTTEALKGGEIDIVGMARPFITNIQDIKGFIGGEVQNLADMVIKTGIQDLEDSAEGGFYARNIIRLSKNKEVKFNFSSIGNAAFLIKHEMVKGLKRKLFGNK